MWLHDIEGEERVKIEEEEDFQVKKYTYGLTEALMTS